MEQRALLSVTTLSQTWKQFDFVGTGPLKGTFQGGPLPTGITGNLAGQVEVAGLVTYGSQLDGQGQGTVKGSITASVLGKPLGTTDIQTPADENSQIQDSNAQLTITVPGQTDASGQPMALTGTINPKDFSVTASTTLAIQGGTGSGTWKGKVAPKVLEPLTVQVTPEWVPGTIGTVKVVVSVGGSVQKVASRTTAVATVNLAWGNGSGKQITKLPDKIPIFWNQAGGEYEIDKLPTPSVKATHLVLVTKIGRQSQTTVLSLADSPTTAVLQIGSVQVAEPSRGTTNVVFPVTLTGESLAPVTVKYWTVGGTATSGKDFTAVSKTLTFTRGGPTTQYITVKIKSDKLAEDAEQFSVQLSSPMYAMLSPDPGQGRGTIIP